MDRVENDEIFRLILNSALDAIICIDPQGCITFWSQQAERIFGWKESEVKGKQLSDTIIPDRYRSSHINGLRRHADKDELMMTGRVMEMEALDRTGREFPVELTIVPVVQNGNEFFCGFIRDISDRKNAEEQVRKEKELSDSVIDSLPGIFYIQDFEGHYLRWNKNFEIASGYSTEEIKNLNPMNFFRPEDRKYIEAAIRKVEREGRAEIGSEVITRDGRVLPFFLKARAIDYMGKKCLVGTGIDLSKQLQAQEAIRKSEEKYRSLFEQASDAIMVTDFTGNFQDVNESLCRMFGYTKNELLGLNIRNLIDADQLKANPISFDRLAAGEHVFSRRKMIHRNGNIIEVEANVRKISEGSVLAIARDITTRIRVENELAESENQLRVIFDTEPECIKLLDADCRVIKMNPAGLDIIEADGPEQVIGQSVLPLVDDTFRNEFMEVTRNVFNGISGNLEFSMHSIKGTRRIMEMHAVPLRNKEGVITCSLSVARDITERKKSEEALRLSEQKYKLLFDRNPIPMLMASAGSLRFIDVNDAAILQYGYSKDEFMNLTLLDIRSAEEGDRLLNSFKKNANGIHRFGIWRHRKKDGTVLRVEVIAQQIRYNSQLVWLAMANDVTEKILAEESLSRSHEQLRQLSSHLENIREEERTKIAREIHDELGQQLTGLKMDAAWLNKKIPPGNSALNAKIEDMISLIDDTVKTVRRISSELRPGILDDLGLIDALQWQSTEFQKRTGIVCIFNTRLSESVFEKQLSTGIFRVYQEALTNVARHSKATEIGTTLGQEKEFVVLEVKDNGQGFEENQVRKKNTLGLVGMKERAIMFGGTLTVRSEVGKGTVITLQVPMQMAVATPLAT